MGLRLPKGVADAVGFREGDRVSIEVQKGAVIIRPAKPKYTLDELVEGITPENLHGEIESSGPIGTEDVW